MSAPDTRVREWPRSGFPPTARWATPQKKMTEHLPSPIGPMQQPQPSV